jgi:cell division protein FtsB
MRRRPKPITQLRPRRSILHALWMPLATAAFLGYFGYHAFTGSLGIWSMDRLIEQTAQLSGDLAGLKRQRAALETKVMRVRPNSLDADLIDSSARGALNVMRADEVILAPAAPR